MANWKEQWLMLNIWTWQDVFYECCTGLWSGKSEIEGGEKAASSYEAAIRRVQ